MGNFVDLPSQAQKRINLLGSPSQVYYTLGREEDEKGQNTTAAPIAEKLMPPINRNKSDVVMNHTQRRYKLRHYADRNHLNPASQNYAFSLSVLLNQEQVFSQNSPQRTDEQIRASAQNIKNILNTIRTRQGKKASSLTPSTKPSYLRLISSQKD